MSPHHTSQKPALAPVLSQAWAVIKHGFFVFISIILVASLFETGLKLFSSEFLSNSDWIKKSVVIYILLLLYCFFIGTIVYISYSIIFKGKINYYNYIPYYFCENGKIKFLEIFKDIIDRFGPYTIIISMYIFNYYSVISLMKIVYNFENDYLRFSLIFVIVIYSVWFILSFSLVLPVLLLTDARLKHAISFGYSLAKNNRFIIFSVFEIALLSLVFLYFASDILLQFCYDSSVGDVFSETSNTFICSFIRIMSIAIAKLTTITIGFILLTATYKKIQYDF